MPPAAAIERPLLFVIFVSFVVRNLRSFSFSVSPVPPVNRSLRNSESPHPRLTSKRLSPIIRRALMKASFAVSTLSVFLLAVLGAQEGHPLVGSWHGDRGNGPKNRTDVTLVMDWDGMRITGVVNPGFESMALQNARLVPKDWSVHFELESKDRS